jgi:hypothetical protein
VKAGTRERMAMAADIVTTLHAVNPRHAAEYVALVGERVDLAFELAESDRAWRYAHAVHAEYQAAEQALTAAGGAR